MDSTHPKARLADCTKFHKAPIVSYSVLSGRLWARSPWGRRCHAALPRRAAPRGTSAAGTEAFGSKQLCDLPSIWKNCSQGIYLDIGTNVGVQLRKLYDPQQFPNATVLPIFDKMFGKQRSGVCAIGVEANTHHTAYLQKLNAYFKQRGYQAMVLTEVAAATHSGRATFFLDPESPVEWGASLTDGYWQHNGEGKPKATAHVNLLDLPAFVASVVRPVLQEELMATDRLPPVVMKLDVEGEEYSLFPGLMLSGGLCDLSMVFLEAHHDSFRGPNGVKLNITDMQQTFDVMRKANPHCRVEVLDLDDESYLDGKSIPLPEVTPDGNNSKSGSG